jgi:hypothetical protein
MNQHKPCHVLPLHPARRAAAMLRRARVTAHSRPAADPIEMELRLLPSETKRSNNIANLHP